MGPSTLITGSLGKKKSPLTIIYSCASYPQAGNIASEIINLLWKKLFKELDNFTKSA